MRRPERPPPSNRDQALTTNGDDGATPSRRPNRDADRSRSRPSRDAGPKNLDASGSPRGPTPSGPAGFGGLAHWRGRDRAPAWPKPAPPRMPLSPPGARRRWLSGLLLLFPFPTLVFWPPYDTVSHPF